MNRRLDSLELNRLEGMLRLVISLCSLIVMWESCLQDRHKCLLAKEIFCQECSGFSTHVILHTCHFCWFKTCCQRCFSRFSAAPANRLWGPQPNWHVDFLQLIGENYRRMVIPQITGLDIDTWTQIGSGGGMSKCYLTWDGDFKWGGACQLKFRLTGDVVFFYLFFFFGQGSKSCDHPQIFFAWCGIKYRFVLVSVSLLLLSMIWKVLTSHLKSHTKALMTCTWACCLVA